MRYICCLLSLASLASAQILTSTYTWDQGDTIVVSGTTNRLGATTYEVISTITSGGAAAAAATTTAATTSETTQLRVVGQEDTTSEVETVFRYTTTNAAGDKVVRTATFTPSFAPTLTPAEPSAGTRYDYSEYTALIGPSLSAQYAAATLAAGQSGGSARLSGVLGGRTAGAILAGALVGAGAVLIGFA